MKSPLSPTRSRVAASTIGILVSVAFVVFAMARLDANEVLVSLRSAQLWPYLALAVTVYLAGQVVRGVRCRILLRRQATLPVTTATNVVVVGYATNNVLPARLGEIARAAMLAERTGVPIAHALTVTLLERVLDGVTILALLVVASILHPGTGWIGVTVRLGALVFGSAALGVALCGLLPEAARAAVSSLTRGLPPKVHGIAVRTIGSITNGLSFLQSGRDVVQAISLSIIVWTLESCMFLALLPALHLPLNPVMAVVTMAVTNLGILVPSSPGFIGPFHFFCMKAVQSFGVQPAVSLGYAVLVHATFYVPITLWGVGALAWYGVQLGSLLSLNRSAKEARALLQIDRVFQVVAPAQYPGSAPIAPEPSELLSRLSEALIPWSSVSIPPEKRTLLLARVAAFAAGQLAALPLRLRVLLRVGLGGFRAATFVRHGKGFCALRREMRVSVAEHWAYRGWHLQRMLFRPIRSIVLLGFFEQPEVAAAFSSSSRTARRLASSA